ncbi:MAG: metallophosphoesterase [Holophagaceae bacterium]
MRLLPRLLLLPALLASAVLAAQARQDGPYVLWEGGTARVFEIREQDALGERRVQAPFTLELPGMAARGLRLTGKPYAPAAEALPDPGKILAVSDIHGRFGAVLALLQAQKVVDADLRWTFGRGHLVVVGDVFDRGPQVTEALWFLRALEEGARAAGGAVHLVLGNHEAMAMGGDARYLHPKYARPPKGLPAYPVLYGPDSELGRWLRSRPALLKLGPFLFVHGGPSAEFLKLGLSQAAANRALRTSLGRHPRDLDGPEGFLQGDQGPLWYRGLVPGHARADASGEDVDAALKAFRVKAVVIGHTTLDRLTALHGGKVYAIDAGLKEGRPGEAWIWEQGKVWRGTADGRREPLAP